MQRTPSEKHDIITPCGDMQYSVVYKKIRHIYFRIDEAGCVIVSCSSGVSKATIEKTIHRLSAKIRSQIDKKMARQMSAPTYVAGDILYYGGEKYTLKIDTNQLELLKIDASEKIIIANTVEPKAIRQLYLEQLAIKTRTSVEIALGELSSYFADMGVQPHKIIYKQLISKWGHCKTTKDNGKSTICFNTMLGMATNQTIEYVVAHELTHMLVPNHSKKFYQELAKIAPHYLGNRAELKKYDVKGILAKGDN